MGDKFASNHGLGGEGDAHEDAQFEVVGIFKPSNTVLDQLIVTNTQSFWVVHEHAQEELHGTPEMPEATPSVNEPLDDRTALLAADSTKQITALLVQFKEKRNVQVLNFQRNINQNTDMQAATPALEINRLYEMMGVGESALKSLAMLIIFVSGLSIFFLSMS